MIEIPNLITDVDLVTKIGELTVHILNVEKSYEELKQSSDTLKSDNTLLKNETNVFKSENTQLQASIKNLNLNLENLTKEKERQTEVLRKEIATSKVESDKKLNDLSLSVKKKEKTINDLKEILERTRLVKKKSLKSKRKVIA
jgi:chromosome segregation ATPase